MSEVGDFFGNILGAISEVHFVNDGKETNINLKIKNERPYDAKGPILLEDNNEDDNNEDDIIKID